MITADHMHGFETGCSFLATTQFRGCLHPKQDLVASLKSDTRILQVLSDHWIIKQSAPDCVLISWILCDCLYQHILCGGKIASETI